jgi:hypothetical protein
MKMLVDVDSARASARLRSVTKQVRYGAGLGLANTGREVKQAEQDEIRRVFDRPTRYTQNAPYLSVSKDRLAAEVWLKGSSRGDAAGAAQATAGASRGHYLEPQIFGGGRQHKRFEELLHGQHVLPAGWYAIPGPGARYDRNGNMKPAQIVEILSAFRAFVLAGSSMNRTDRSEARRQTKLKRYFVSHPRTPQRARNGGRLPFGVYERFRDGRIKTILRFVPRVSYRQRFDFFRVGRTVVDQRLVPNIEAGIQRAFATAR